MRIQKFFAGAIVAVIAFASGSSFAAVQPSHYCDSGVPTGQGLSVAIGTKQSAVCFDQLGYLKGAVMVETKHNSIVLDGDASNYYGRLGPCSSGYVGISFGASGNDPHLVWSPTGNYDPSKPEGAPGSPNHRFDPKSDPGTVSSACAGQ